MYKGNNMYDPGDYRGPLYDNGFPQREPDSARSSISRPSAKAIYNQRKEYAESMNRQPDNLQYRVEHLFTCELDGKDVCTVDDCISRLKLLDAKGRVWGQDMILEVRDGRLQLTDIETKEELESFPLGSIADSKAVLHSCVYDSILTVTVQERSKRKASVFLFQCEDVGAEHVQADMEKVVHHRREDSGDQGNIRNNLENLIGQKTPGQQRNKAPPPLLPPGDRWSEPPEWNSPDYEDDQFTPRDEPPYLEEEPLDMQSSEIERNVDILNHVLNDVEMFMGIVAAVVAAIPAGYDKKKKKSKKNKNQEPGIDGLPPLEEFVACLQKIKYGFNLLGKLNGQIHNPSAEDFVHILFSALSFLVTHCPRADLPPSILIPLLTPQAIQLLSRVVSAEEEQLWRSHGEAWNVPRAQWPNADAIPPYVPVFSDGWQPPSPTMMPQVNRASMRREGRGDNLERDQPYPPEQNSGPWSYPPTRSNETPHYMRVMYDFNARNTQELSAMKADIVQVLDDSRQWWLVRNIREQEGYIPHNVLESLEADDTQSDYQELLSPPTLNKKSKPEEVKAWLEYKGFSKITVRCLGVLSGSLLLGMTRDELKTVCPEEGGRVFFQLQSVKSSLALASESGHDSYYSR
ncbi:epidermal growth factor receptor kinase substrate 8-like protein 3 [Amia ocellicauda]|uniref:epidermal growth factor receptor kinase substrate 8-like protein 3 n=1 Tax=Amia ocellicauda TaxID=2972642 RepID=UPI003464A56B